MVLRDNLPKLRNHAPFCLSTAQDSKTRRFPPTLLKLLFLRRQDESAHFPPTTACGWIRRTNEADETTGKETRWQILVWRGKLNQSLRKLICQWLVSQTPTPRMFAVLVGGLTHARRITPPGHHRVAATPKPTIARWSISQTFELGHSDGSCLVHCSFPAMNPFLQRCPGHLFCSQRTPIHHTTFTCILCQHIMAVSPRRSEASGFLKTKKEKKPSCHQGDRVTMAEHEQSRNDAPLAMELQEWLRAPTTLVHASRVTEFAQNSLLLSISPKAKNPIFSLRAPFWWLLGA